MARGAAGGTHNDPHPGAQERADPPHKGEGKSRAALAPNKAPDPKALRSCAPPQHAALEARHHGLQREQERDQDQGPGKHVGDGE